MKELSIEQKAKAYEEAIERAKKQLDGAKVFDYKEKQIAHDVRTTTYAIFPELKESEDEEKIKKALISAINNICNGDEGLVTFNGFSKEQVLAWLEKQSGKKPADKCEGCNNIKGCVACVDGSEWAHIEEHNPAWSEEDEERLKETLAIIETVEDINKAKDAFLGAKMWIKSLKDRVGCEVNCTTTKEWSEEDERIRKALINGFKDYNDLYGEWGFGITPNEAIAWLEKQGKSQVRTGIEWVNTIDDACDKRYAEEYSHGEYCHEQSFKWGFQEGVDWLEKQGEQKPCMIQWKGDNLKEVLDFTGKDKNFDKWFKSFEDYERYVHEHNNTFKLFNEDGSHYEVPVGAWIVKTPDGYNVASKAFFVQKPTEWSEEDRLLINEIIELIDAGSLNREEKDDYIERLKSLKERVHPQPKQEWSEDDEYNFAFIQEALLGLDGDDSYREKCCKMADWLESLKDKFVDFDKGFNVGFSAAKHNQWKPSDEQMERLNGIIYSLPHQEVLYSLYQDLMKLREE